MWGQSALRHTPTMNFEIAVPSLLSRVQRLKVPLQGPLLVALAYLLGAEVAFYIGTLSDQIFALFWPPNVVLFCALMIVPQRDWWLYIVAAFPAHVVASLASGCPRRSCWWHSPPIAWWRC